MLFKLVGVMLLVTASSYIGINMSQTLKERVIRIELIKRMLDEISTLIRHRALTVSEIVDELNKSTVYKELDFINFAKNDITERIPFSNVWEKSIIRDKKLFQEERKELISLGYSLGTSDIDGQLSALSIIKNKFDIIAEKSNFEYTKKGKLYRTLGVLCGVFISILLI